MLSYGPRALIFAGAALCLTAAGLLWHIIFTPELSELRSYTIVTIGLFAAGLLLICLTPLMVGALAPADDRRRSAHAAAGAPDRRTATIARLLLWVILAEFAVLAWLG